VTAPRPPQTVPMPVPSPRRNDPIADLIGPSPRILAVQRVLSNYGYGQIKPTGSLDDATSQAIEKFEREHKLPVSGRVSDRLVNELAAMTGHPIE
jgi:peptidoglycan hydrolase-like protein with peptidoglycan-binding domain